MEKSFINNNLQNFPESIYQISNLVSAPFHLKLFIIVLIVLYYENLITPSQIFLLISCQFLLIMIKYLFKRPRPFIDSNIINREWLMVDYYSFPSGHTFNAFMLYYILLNNGIITSKYKIIPYLVGISRVLLGVHYPTDVLGGALLAKLIMIIYKYSS